MFRFEVTTEVFERFPDYVVACVLARGIDNANANAAVQQLLSDAAARSRISYEGVDLKSLPQFAAWRDAFSRAGWSASRFPASVEALHRRVQRGSDPPSINPAVDLSNSAVLFYSVPIGTHDIRSLGGEALVVRPARDGDQFFDMSGEPDPPAPGEIVYAAGSVVRTRRWVWRQSRDALVGPDATDVFFPIDGFADQTLEAVEAACNFLAQSCTHYLGAEVTTGTVSAAQPAFTG